MDAEKQGKVPTFVTTSSVTDQPTRDASLTNIRHADDALLAELGYKSEFKREFSVSQFSSLVRGWPLTSLQLLETIAFAFSIMGVIASVSSTYSFPLVSGTHDRRSHQSFFSFFTGGHVGMVFGWLIPSLFVMAIAASMAEMTSSMP